MTSVKIDATVSEWIDGANAAVNLPDNGNGEAGQGGGSDQPAVAPGTEYNVIVTNADGVPVVPNVAMTLTVTEPGTVVEGMVEVVATSENADYNGKTYYVDYATLADGGVVELFTGTPSRMTRAFSGTGTYVKLAGDEPIEPTMFTLSVTANNGGTASSDPNSEQVEDGTSVTVTANANSGFIFSGWSGTFISGDNPCTFTIDKNTELTAHFEGLPLEVSSNVQYTVTSTDPDLPSSVEVNETPSGGLNNIQVGSSFANDYYRIQIDDNVLYTLSDSNYRFVLKTEFDNAKVGDTITLYKITGVNPIFINTRKMEACGTMTITGIDN